MFDKLQLIISSKEKKKLFLLVLLLIFSTLIEILSIGSIPIFATIMIEPSLVTEKLSEYFKIEVTYDLARNDTIIYGSIFLVAIFILKNTLISLINYFHGTIQKSLKAKLAEKLLGNTSIQITNFSFQKVHQK